MAEPLLATKDLTIQFDTHRGPVKAVNDISFALEPREILGLVGETGSGKSVLAWSLVGIVPPPGKVVKGDVYFQGVGLHGKVEEGIRRIRGKELGLIVQNARAHLNPLVQVGQQIANAYRAHVEASRKEALAKAVEMLHIVAIPDPEQRVRAYPHELSGGMAQRVITAMAIMHSPKVLIADEPTMGLDVTIQAQILDFLADLVHRLGSSTLLVTRDMGIVANYCQRVGVLYAGQLVEIAPMEAFFARPRHPYSIALLDAVSFLGYDRQRRAKFLKQVPRSPFSLPEGCYYHARCGFADALCRQVHPELEEVAPGHLVRCHHHGEVATWKPS
jgi:oligopeptide/dipeptide ABC transporter ATP-binding protein